MSFLMSDILDDIRTLSANELEDLGSDSDTQNAAIFRFTNIILDKRVRQAYNVAFSDPLTIAADGFQTFLKDTVAVTDMYEPLGIYGPSGTQTLKRTSWDAPDGWWRESDNLSIHTKGLTGANTLKYIRYATAVSASTDTVEYPRAGKWDLIYDVVAMVKLIKNYYQESDYIKAKATGTATVKASISAKGSNSAPPSPVDREE
jgi:hypothetical protein